MTKQTRMTQFIAATNYQHQNEEDSDDESIMVEGDQTFGIQFENEKVEDELDPYIRLTQIIQEKEKMGQN
jgi:hypothetical protein